MKEKIFLVLIGLLTVCFGAVAETDTRTEVTDVVATCTPDLASIVSYGNSTLQPTFTMSEGSVATIHSYDFQWQKKNKKGLWEEYYGYVFTVGTYRASVKVLIDGTNGKTHKLADIWTLTINGQAWTTDTTSYETDRCYGYAYSQEYTVTNEIETVIQELTLTGLTKPVVGKMPDDKKISLGDNVNIIIKFWSVRYESGDWDVMLEDGSYNKPFEAGKEYSFFLEAIPDEGYSFSPHLKVIFNSKEIPDYDEDTNTNTFKDITEDGMLHIRIHQDCFLTSPVDLTFTESEAPADVYNLQGILVKRNATVEDLHSLPAGIYIMSGKKILVK